jgi:hypothetical protein
MRGGHQVNGDLPEPRSELGLALSALVRLIAWLRGLGPFAGVGLALAGAVLLTAADRLRRPAAVVGGAAVGALAARAGAPVLPASLSLAGWCWLGAILCGGAAGVWPILFPALAGALVGALLGVQVPVAGQPAIGAALAAAVGAALLAVGARSAAVVLACLGGGLAVGVGFIVLAGGRELAAELAARPLVVLGFAVVMCVAGAAFQLAGEKGRSRAPQAPKLPRE